MISTFTVFGDTFLRNEVKSVVMVLKLIKLISQAKLLRPERQVATSLSKALRNSLPPFLISYAFIIFMPFRYLYRYLIKQSIAYVAIT